MNVAALHTEAKERYWKGKDLPASRRLLEQGIALARAQGDLHAEKPLQYDLASFCWPGWDEAGIAISPEDLVAGERAADENLRLAQTLDRPPTGMANAWFMVGAYHLVRRRWQAAEESFGLQAEFAGKAEDPDRLVLAAGYRMMASILGGYDHPFGEIVEATRTNAPTHGQEFADQLETAARVFGATPSPGKSGAEPRSPKRVVIEAVDPVQEAEGLAEVLHACVHAGASVHFVLPFSRDEAAGYWRGISGRIVLAAREEGRIVGTVSLIVEMPPNQRHRAEVAKMLVHPEFRRRGIARALLEGLEGVARREKRTLLTLDTVTGGEAEGLYRSAGYEFAGSIPDFARSTDGRSMESTSLYFKRL